MTDRMGHCESSKLFGVSACLYTTMLQCFNYEPNEPSWRQTTDAVLLNRVSKLLTRDYNRFHHDAFFLEPFY